MLAWHLGYVLFPANSLPIDPNAMVKLTDKSFYAVADRKWLCYPDFSRFKDDVDRADATATFFNRFTRFCWIIHGDKHISLPNVARRWSVTESPRLRSDGSIVTSYGMALAEDGRGDLQWRDVLCDVQIEDAAENMSNAIERLTTGAAQVFATQEHRLFHLGLALAGDTYQLAYFDRAGRVLSGTFDVHEHAALFARIIMGLTLLDTSYAGLDPSIVLRDGQRFLEVCGDEYEILETICINTNLLGRGTVSWRCRRADSDEDFVIKNVWVDEQTGDREGMFLKRARRIEGIPNLACEELVLGRDGQPCSTTRVRLSSQGKKSPIVPDSIARLVLRRLVLQPYARPLRDFSSKDELLELMNDAIQAHKELYLWADALHCDISENNIMARDLPNSSRRRGLLIDLDSAVVVSGKPKLGPACGLRGTLPYMAIDVLREPTLVERAPWHDLESFLYVLMILCASYSGPSNTYRRGFDIHKSRLGPWFSGDGDYKAEVMRYYDDAKFRAFLDEVFDPYFDDLKDVVCDLRNIITRPKDACPSHVDVMIVIGKHIRARQASQKRAAAAPQCPPAAVETKRSERAKRKRVTAAAPAPPAPRPAASGKSRRMTTRSKAQAPPRRTPSPASDDSERTVVLTPPRRQTRSATKRAQDTKPAEMDVGMAGATRAAKRRRMA
ncbi:hypothetical protein K525DRAFT_246559 [Schizophyllum commune Loenen D]|nr:hypothetical protein K525DRAFT_246559 [Schizophyllum commune Loenen D]